MATFEPVDRLKTTLGPRGERIFHVKIVDDRLLEEGCALQTLLALPFNEMIRLNVPEVWTAAAENTDSRFSNHTQVGQLQASAITDIISSENQPDVVGIVRFCIEELRFRCSESLPGKLHPHGALAASGLESHDKDGIYDLLELYGNQDD
mmetsp:Transcript_40154/g.99913  ORF Transcript_40154/g.99913 Transcript_40154/m.99913 type:complete len:150 (-) Transcript_40154:120-569(-)